MTTLPPLPKFQRPPRPSRNPTYRAFSPYAAELTDEQCHQRAFALAREAYPHAVIESFRPATVGDGRVALRGQP